MLSPRREASYTTIIDECQTQPWIPFSSMISCSYPDSYKKNPSHSCLGECPICFEKIHQDTAQTLRCGHIFHESCCNRIVNPQPKKCPLCPVCCSPFINEEMSRNIETQRRIATRNIKRGGFMRHFRGLKNVEKRTILFCDFFFLIQIGIRVSDMDFTRIEAQHIWNSAQLRHLARIGVCDMKKPIMRALNELRAKFEPNIEMKPDKLGYYLWNADNFDRKYAIHSVEYSIKFVKKRFRRTRSCDVDHIIF